MEHEKVNEIVSRIPLIIEKTSKISKDHKINTEELILELVRFLDLIHCTNQHLSPSLVVDLAWHEFILFTKFYNEFCIKHYDRFIHHTPSKKGSQQLFEKTIKLYIQKYKYPNPKIWGDLAKKEWELTNCGSCHN